MKNSKEVSSVDRGRRGKWLRRTGGKPQTFRYLNSDGTFVKDNETLERISALVIPPAWRNVRICPLAGGKIQAVGLDAKGRLQYIYHPRFAAAQNRKKFARIEEFGEYFPKLRKETNEHISLEGFPLVKVLAIMTRLMNVLFIRMGSNKSEKEFRTYGITTLRKKHVVFNGSLRVTFEFVGKSHIKQRRVLVDRELAALLKELSGLGRGGKFFKYLDTEDKLKAVTPNHLNQYIKSVTAAKFSAKDFRTWGATINAAVELAKLGPPADDAAAKKNLMRTVKKVAELLGNTPAVCRNSYIHPAIFDAYSKGVDFSSVVGKTNRNSSRFASEDDVIEQKMCALFRDGMNI